MSDEIKRWLAEHGLGKYVEVFVENEIDVSHLPLLNDEDLRELGLPMGPRKQLLAAVTEAASSGSDARIGEAERRQLTVMFCDLAGSTELSQKLDPEELRDISRAYQDACKAAIERYDGYVARYMGDGVLAYFGYPQAHEDDAERAVHAGLGVVESVAELPAPALAGSNLALEVRVGIATGPVVVGDLIGEGASQESAVVGETEVRVAVRPYASQPLAAFEDRAVEPFGPQNSRGRESGDPRADYPDVLCGPRLHC